MILATVAARREAPEIAPVCSVGRQIGSSPDGWARMRHCGAMTAQARAYQEVHWADEPLSAETEDELGRAPFVETVTKQIDRAAANDPSTVFGLVGEWGSGKTSIIEQVRPKLSADWVIADFTPWSSGDASAMSFEFVATLADALGVSAAGQSREKFARYAGIVTPFLNAIPVAGSGASAAATEFLSALASRPPWHKQFEELSETVAATGLRVLIVIDDVDRLGGAELMNLLRVVRLLGRFRGVHYLMAYDQTTIEELLEASGSVGRGTSFMEKIVQYPFEVPPISRASALRLTHQVIARVLEATGSHLDDVGLYRENELAQVLAGMIRTPRTLGRFASQLLSFAAHVRDAELDVLDYVAITWLRLEAHGVWTHLPRWRSELSTGSRPSGILKTEKIPLDEWLARFSGAHPDSEPTDAAKVLELMFPGFSLAEVSSYYEHPRAVANEAYFGRYLLLALPEDDVSDELIEGVIGELVADESSPGITQLSAVLDGADEIANLAISRAFQHRRNAPTSSRALVEFLFSRVKSRADETSGPGSPRTALNPWLAREIALNIEADSIQPDEVIAAIGEADTFSIVMQFTNVLRDRNRAKTLARGFADYWLDAVSSRTDELLEAPQLLANAIELITYAHGVDRIQGIFDGVVTDFASYMRVATAFVRFTRWVGSDISYEMEFARGAFEAIIPAHTREHFAGEMSSARSGVTYETDDLPEPIVAEDILWEFVIDSLLRGETSDDIPAE